MEWRPGEDHTIDRPRSYDFWQSYQADFWPGPKLGWRMQSPETGRPLSRPLFLSGDGICGRSAGSGTAATTSRKCQTSPS
jgi:hypothetical protein